MRLPIAEDLRYLEGEISQWHVANGRLHIQIGSERVSLRQSRFTRKFKNGDSMRVLMRQRAGSGACELLAYQRRGQRRIHYAGLHVSPVVILIAVALCVLAYVVRSDLVLMPAIVLLGLELAVAVRRWWVLRTFDLFERRAAEVPEKDSEGRAAVALTPLDLTFAGRHNSFPPRASNLPSEILEFTHDAIIIWEMDGAGIVYWNRAAEQLYGYSREQAYGKVTHQLLRTQLAGGVGELETRLARYGVWIGDLCHTRSDGRKVEVEGRLSLMSQEHRPWLVLEVNRDVTDRNLANAARLEMQQQLARLRNQQREDRDDS